jgi:Helix-turn-helix
MHGSRALSTDAGTERSNNRTIVRGLIDHKMIASRDACIATAHRLKHPATKDGGRAVSGGFGGRCSDAGVDRSYVSRFEHGTVSAGVDMLEKIAEARGCKLAELFRERAEGEREPKPLRGGRKPRT